MFSGNIKITHDNITVVLEVVCKTCCQNTK